MLKKIPRNYTFQRDEIRLQISNVFTVIALHLAALFLFGPYKILNLLSLSLSSRFCKNKKINTRTTTPH